MHLSLPPSFTAAAFALAAPAVLLVPARAEPPARVPAVESPAPPAGAWSAALKPSAVLGVMERVAAWQLAHPSSHPATDWTQAAGDTGMLALAGISGDRAYRDAMVRMGETNNWQLGPRAYHADDHCIGQTYAELYFQLREPKMIAALKARCDDILANPHDGTLEFRTPGCQDRWSWCDALFMAPAAWLRLSVATGDTRYLEFAVNQWWRTADYLYDKKEHLYYRDSTYFQRREANGKHVFWSRGNGWVMGGLVRMLQYLPSNHPARPRFEQQFREMAAAILACQQSDGLWRASLLDPASYPLQETSGSGFYTYALAWGINQKLLDRAPCEPAVRRAWAALVACVQADGMLTHVQPIGADPKAFAGDSTEVYGTGAFLLAGSEIYRMAALGADRPHEVSVSNPADFSRSCETVAAPCPAGMQTPVVMDALTSRCLASQVCGGQLLFQVDLAPGETRRFLVLDRAQLAAVPPVDVRAHARFVPERLDDFAWESDRIAHRVYGPAIMTDPKEHLVSSGVDVWVKSVRYPVIDKWYQTDNYHQNHGEGLDNYKVGTARGCGGLGIWDGKKLWVSANFKSWKVLADGPLRAEFELTYGPWNVGGRSVSEVKHISIDAGSNMSRVTSVFTSDQDAPLVVAVGINQRPQGGQLTRDDDGTWLSYWEPELAPNGSIACAVIVPDSQATGFATTSAEACVLGKAHPGKPFVHFLGAGWSQSGDFPDRAAWERYVRDFARRVQVPLVVK